MRTPKCTHAGLIAISRQNAWADNKRFGVRIEERKYLYWCSAFWCVNQWSLQHNLHSSAFGLSKAGFKLDVKKWAQSWHTQSKWPPSTIDILVFFWTGPRFHWLMAKLVGRFLYHSSHALHIHCILLKAVEAGWSCWKQVCNKLGNKFQKASGNFQRGSRSARLEWGHGQLLL